MKSPDKQNFNLLTVVRTIENITVKGFKKLDNFIGELAKKDNRLIYDVEAQKIANYVVLVGLTLIPLNCVMSAPPAIETLTTNITAELPVPSNVDIKPPVINNTSTPTPTPKPRYTLPSIATELYYYFGDKPEPDKYISSSVKREDNILYLTAPSTNNIGDIDVKINLDTLTAEGTRTQESYVNSFCSDEDFEPEKCVVKIENQGEYSTLRFYDPHLDAPTYVPDAPDYNYHQINGSWFFNHSKLIIPSTYLKPQN